MSSAGSYEVLTYDNPEQREKWRALCQLLPICDIYFYPEYAYLFELHGDGEAHCFVYYETEDDFVIYPFLKRSINKISLFADLPDNLYDIITPYGYGGYLRSSAKVDMNKFYDNFKIYCKEKGIVSEFVRFHPLIKNHYYCPNVVNIEHWNDTVIIDLTVNDEMIYKSMHKSRRYKIRKCIKNDVKIIFNNNFDNLNEFYKIYNETMVRVGSSEYYMFSKKWFFNLFYLLKNRCILICALKNNKIISSTIFIFNMPFFHNYLGGTLNDMLFLSPHCLLIYEAALWAKKQGYKYFHLGGGLKQNDDLFKYKAQFSPMMSQYYIAKIVHLEDIYRFLCDRWLAAHQGKAVQMDFFPLYRSP